MALNITNPLLNTEELPGFSKIDPEDIYDTVKSIIDDNENTIDSLLQIQQDKLTWNTLQEPIDQINNKLNNAWSLVNHINSVANTPALRSVYNSCLPLISDHATKIGQNSKLYNAYKTIKNSDYFSDLPFAQKTVINHQLRDFKLAGVGLSSTKKNKFREITTRLSEAMNNFANNVLDSTMAWTKLISDKNKLSGVPESVLKHAQKLAKEKHNKSGYLLTLDAPCYIPIMTYCDNRALRQEIYKAYCTRASEQNSYEYDNSLLLAEILKLRHEMASLLNFNNYAEYSLATKMADTPETVIEFLNSLVKQCKPKAEQELKGLERFSRENLNIPDLKSWDINYCSEKLQEHLYNISQEELRPWFPINKVLEGLFNISNKLYGISIRQMEDLIDVWHPDVLLFEISQEKETIAYFYLDLYARENKRGGAWMDECRTRMKSNNTLQLPIAYLVCNFSNPINDEPALLTHEEALTLFHEFGHGIHHMLTKMEYLDISGINGVPWDAVELPSQFMENWCWRQEALPMFSGHWKTSEPISSDTLQKLINAKNFNSAMSLLRQLELGLFDIMLHKNYSPDIHVQNILNEIRNQVAVIIPPEFNRMQHSFTHIFSGGYAAGYYGYLWSEVLSADAFSRFEHEGIFNPETGKSFLKEILEQGGSSDPMDLFLNFLGRKPSPDALLRHRGII